MVRELGGAIGNDSLHHSRKPARSAPVSRRHLPAVPIRSSSIARTTAGFLKKFEASRAEAAARSTVTHEQASSCRSVSRRPEPSGPYAAASHRSLIKTEYRVTACSVNYPATLIGKRPPTRPCNEKPGESHETQAETSRARNRPWTRRCTDCAHSAPSAASAAL
jgi:hypothetical protein